MLKKNYIIISLFCLISFNSYSNGNESYLEKCTDYIDGKINDFCDWAYDNPKYSLPLIAGTTASSTILAYKKIEFFRKKINQLCDRSQNFFKEEILFPLLLKYEIIKDEGLSKKDMIILASLALGSYGVKKANDHFEIFKHGKSFGKKSLDYIWQGLKFVGRYARNNKSDVLVGFAGLAIVGFLWSIYKDFQLDNQALNSPFDNFLKTLTYEQRLQILQSPKLFDLIGQAQDSPSLLIENKSFFDLLDDKQKEFLNKIVESQE